MTAKDQAADERDELGLETESVQDLDVDDDVTDAVRGGPCTRSNQGQ
jgi:hypothetical protein